MSKIERAILYATFAHADMTRKSKERAYILHPIEAMTIVGSITNDEDVLAAAVLHDTVEDTGVTNEDILRLFGPRVAGLVAAESEDKRAGQKAEDTWMVRKQETIALMEKAGRDERLVCLGDKLSNLREIARDYERTGETFWQRFNQKDPEMHGWYYRSLYEILRTEFEGTPAIEEYRVLMEKVFGK